MMYKSWLIWLIIFNCYPGKLIGFSTNNNIYLVTIIWTMMINVDTKNVQREKRINAMEILFLVRKCWFYSARLFVRGWVMSLPANEINKMESYSIKLIPLFSYNLRITYIFSQTNIKSTSDCSNDIFCLLAPIKFSRFRWLPDVWLWQRTFFRTVIIVYRFVTEIKPWVKFI